MRRLLPGVSGLSVALGALWVLVVSLSGGWVTQLGPWYRALQKPSWQPPDWAFGPVWTVIFALAATAFVLAWNAPGREGGEPFRARLVGAYVLNGALNVLWSFLFFRLQRPDWALWETLALAGSIVVMMVVVYPRSRLGAGLLAPYLAWVGFAFALNLAIVRLNAPFGAG